MLYCPIWVCIGLDSYHYFHIVGQLLSIHSSFLWLYTLGQLVLSALLLQLPYEQAPDSIYRDDVSVRQLACEPLQWSHALLFELLESHLGLSFSLVLLSPIKALNIKRVSII